MTGFLKKRPKWEKLLLYCTFLTDIWLKLQQILEHVQDVDYLNHECIIWAILDARKPVFGISDKARFKPACSVTETRNFPRSKTRYDTIQ